MTTILLDEPHLPRFDKADPTGELEAPFEAVALRLLSRLYPSCRVFPFKPRVVHNGVGWRPDLAIIDRDWAYWFVVEVEIATHSLEKHVIPQVRAFRDGDFGDDAADMIAHISGVTPDKAATLLRFVPRYVAVVSNHEDDSWSRQLTAENIQYLSVCDYSRPAGCSAFLISGALRPAQRSIGFGIALPANQALRFPRTPFWQERSYRLTAPTGTAEWECVIDDKVVWLTKRRGIIDFPNRAWVQLLAQDDGMLLLRTL